MNLLGTAFVAFILSISTTMPASAQDSSFTTSNDRSLFDAQTRAMRQKARSQLETDTEKLKDLKETNTELDKQTLRIQECADLDKVYNGDPTGSNLADTYCQGIVGAIPSELNFKGLTAWYDVSTEEGYTIREGYTDQVAELLDKSGNLNHLYHNYTPPVIRTTSDYQAKANNNVSVLAFEGQNHRMTSKSDKMATATGIKGDSAMSIFIVAAPKAHDYQAHGVFSIGNTSGKQIGIFANTKYGAAHGGMGTSSAGGSSIDVAKARLQLIDFHRDRADKFDFYLNGQSFAFGSGTPTLDVQDGLLSVGAVYSTGSAYSFQGDFAELILYNRELSTIERASVQSYLIAKYGLQPFGDCANKNVSTGQCTLLVGTASHGTTSNPTCTGTFGTCTSQQYCNDGTWVEKTNSCPSASNCTTSALRTISAQCNAATGTGNHTATTSLSCTGTYGPCTASSDCFNGAWGSAYNESCQAAPQGCSAVASSSTLIGPQAHMPLANIPALSHGGTYTVNCRDDNTSKDGDCNLSCNNGALSVTLFTEAPACPGLSAGTEVSRVRPDLGSYAKNIYKLVLDLDAGTAGQTVNVSAREYMGNGTSTTGRTVTHMLRCTNNTWKFRFWEDESDCDPSGNYWWANVGSCMEESCGAPDYNLGTEANISSCQTTTQMCPSLNYGKIFNEGLREYTVQQTIPSTLSGQSKSGQCESEFDGAHGGAFSTGICTYICNAGNWERTGYSRTDCAAATMDNGGFQSECNLPNATNGTTAGACSSQSVMGSCSYTCTGSNWIRNHDTCEGD